MVLGNEETFLFQGNGEFNNLCLEASIEAQKIGKGNAYKKWLIRKIIEEAKDLNDESNLTKDIIVALCLNLKDIVPGKILRNKKSSITTLIKSLEELLKEDYKAKENKKG